MRKVSAQYPAKPIHTFHLDELLGLDLESSDGSRSGKRSPNGVNMIREVPGSIRKRMGYYQRHKYGERINGIFFYMKGSERTMLVHSGSQLFIGEASVYGGLSDERSTALQLGDKLFILDGHALLCCDGEAVFRASDRAYLPTLTIGRSPLGGGRAYEALNLLGDSFKDSFLADGTRVYQLSYMGLVPGEVTVEKRGEDGEFYTLPQSDYSFDETLGQVTFVTAPTAPTDGADNVRITAKKDFADNRSMIDSCRFGIQYGVNGDPNRLFISGNPDYPNRDWHSEMQNGFYFPQDSYSVLGLGSEIAAYSVTGNYLATHKGGDEDGRNIIVRTGVMEDGRASFPIVSSLQGSGTLCHSSVAYAADEPMFLTASGIMAITTSDIKGERYQQCRSYYINSAVCGEEGRSAAQAAAYKDFYVLSVGGKMYLLDTMQKSVSGNAPWSSHQYEAYMFDNIPARVLAVDGDILLFGTEDGSVMAFYTDPSDPQSYSDNGEAIAARWDLDFSGRTFYRLKRIHYLALRIAAGDRTSFTLWLREQGVWKQMMDEAQRVRSLCFDSIDFDAFSFSCDRNPITVGAKLKAGRFDTVRLSVRNEKLNEPLGIYELALEFSEEKRSRR